MVYAWFNRGIVRSFNTSISKDTEQWESNPKCRSVRIRNVGDDVCTIESDGIGEPLDLTEVITYGGYPYSNRQEVLNFKFAGVGTNPRIVIVQDIQQTEPTIFTGVAEFIKSCFN